MKLPAAARATSPAGETQLPPIKATLEPSSHLSAVTLLRAPGGGSVRGAGSVRSSQNGFTDLLVHDALCLHCEVGCLRAQRAQ